MPQSFVFNSPLNYRHIVQTYPGSIPTIPLYCALQRTQTDILLAHRRTVLNDHHGNFIYWNRPDRIVQFQNNYFAIPLTFFQSLLILHQSSLLFQPLPLPHLLVHSSHFSQGSRDLPCKHATQMTLYHDSCSSFPDEHYPQLPASVSMLHFQRSVSHAFIFCKRYSNSSRFRE